MHNYLGESVFYLLFTLVITQLSLELTESSSEYYSTSFLLTSLEKFIFFLLSPHRQLDNAPQHVVLNLFKHIFCFRYSSVTIAYQWFCFFHKEKQRDGSRVEGDETGMVRIFVLKLVLLHFLMLRLK